MVCLTAKKKGWLPYRFLTEMYAFYEEGTQKHVPRYDKCPNNGGEYVEK